MGPGPAGAAAAAAAGAAFGFAACFLAKTGEVETARIAKPTTMIFFMLSSLEKTHSSQSQTLDRGQEPQGMSLVCRADQRQRNPPSRNTGNRRITTTLIRLKRSSHIAMPA